MTLQFIVLIFLVIPSLVSPSDLSSIENSVDASLEILSFIEKTGNYFMEPNLLAYNNFKDQLQLQDLFDGMWEQAGLSSPTTIINCLDPVTIENTTQIIGVVLDLALHGKFETLQQNLTVYMNNFPQANLTCLQTNQEVSELLKALNLLSKPQTVIMSQLGVYVAINQAIVWNYIEQSNANFGYGNLKDIGKTFVKVIQLALQENEGKAMWECDAISI